MSVRYRYALMLTCLAAGSSSDTSIGGLEHRLAQLEESDAESVDTTRRDSIELTRVSYTGRTALPRYQKPPRSPGLVRTYMCTHVHMSGLDLS